MPAQLLNLFEPTAITAAATPQSLPAVPANTSWTIVNLTVSNNGSTAAPQVFTVWWVRTGGTAVDAKRMDSFTVPLKPKCSLPVEAMIGQTMMPGDFLIVQCDAANALVVSASGLVGTS